MCGLAGIARAAPTGVPLDALARMAASLRHRGPDGYGFAVDPWVGLAHVRLSIVDPAGGAQPMASEDGAVVVAFNGEVYNHADLRRRLSSLGHRFRTRSDTEVLVHGWEAWGEAMLPRLDGQFAFALRDRRRGTLLLARDRFGVRPLFLAERGGSLLFASEAKALAASGEVRLEVDPQGLDEVFTFWAARAPRTPFLGVRALEPGSLATWRAGRLRLRRWYAPDYPAAGEEPADALERLDALLRASVGQRMLADVPVGSYLSGGLDSGIASALAVRAAEGERIRSFSVAFSDPAFDESRHQHQVAAHLATDHRSRPIGPGDIVEAFPEVVRHCETPLVRTAPAPLYLLARLTREHGVKVVLTGEGADELFLGYDLFKEVAIRRFCLRSPASRRRPLLFGRLYPYLPEAARRGEWWGRSFLRADDAGDPVFSHLPRFLLTSRIKDFYAPAARERLAGFDPVEELRQSLPAAFGGWDPAHRAAHLEMETLLASYLLSSQGDRMSLAHGVEGRYPFLDHRLFEFAAALPARSKLRGLREKEILRRWARPLLPPAILERPKQPYLAPAAAAFFGPGRPAYVEEALGEEALRRAGIFDPRAVAGLVARCRAGRATGFGEGQALVAILSTQLWHEQLVSRPARPEPLPLHGADVLPGRREPDPIPVPTGAPS